MCTAGTGFTGTPETLVVTAAGLRTAALGRTFANRLADPAQRPAAVGRPDTAVAGAGDRRPRPGLGSHRRRASIRPSERCWRNRTRCGGSGSVSTSASTSPPWRDSSRRRWRRNPPTPIASAWRRLSRKPSASMPSPRPHGRRSPTSPSGRCGRRSTSPRKRPGAGSKRGATPRRGSPAPRLTAACPVLEHAVLSACGPELLAGVDLDRTHHGGAATGSSSSGSVAR